MKCPVLLLIQELVISGLRVGDGCKITVCLRTTL